ncbi:ABC transporter permease [Trinickia dinghuensis]|uniref:ABC transporter permease n=1 Tax=Trinickia dinghuensis TaxID=2291023 RepID=A0A3D8K6Q1_9BURK|nr:FtsX-like permease family protein [Trinickia dinghuensis]RDV00566.1 ABC transporter permease [Trinickia dinghuensis]
MKTWILAFRNLQRNRRRSSTTLLAMVIGLTAVLLFGGYTRNINYGLQTSFVRYGGHLQIQRRGYFLYGSGDPVSYGIADYARIVDAVRGDPQLRSMVTVVTPVLAVNGIAGNFAAGVSRTVFGNGIVVDEQRRMREWNDYGFPIASGSLALASTLPNAVVIGTGVARVLRLCTSLKVPNCRDPQPAQDASSQPATPNDLVQLAAAESRSLHGDSPESRTAHIQLLTSNAYGAPNVAQLDVVAAQKQGVKDIDDMYVQLHLAQAQRLVYGGGQPRATSIVVQLRHTADIGRARTALVALLKRTPGGNALDVLDFATLNPQYGQITGMFNAVFGFIAILMATVVMFTVGNTMNMAVMERTHEIGTLRAMGLRDGGVSRIFVCEGCLLGLCGAVLGTLIALAGAALVNHAGLRWMPPGQTDSVALTVRVWGETAMIARNALGILLVATASAWLPARRASRMPIVEALRFS